MEKYMKLALIESKKSLKTKDVPVGAVIVYKNKIVARAHNQKEKFKIATYHAEILAINKVCKKMKSWYLNECILYVTMEPCLMCCGAIIQSRIKKVVYGLPNKNFGHTSILPELFVKHKIVLENYNYENEYIKIVQEFFKDKRKK